MLSDRCIPAFLQSFEKLEYREPETDQRERSAYPTHQRPLERHDRSVECHRGTVCRQLIRCKRNVAHLCLRLLALSCIPGPTPLYLDSQRPAQKCSYHDKDRKDRHVGKGLFEGNGP